MLIYTLLVHFCWVKGMTKTKPGVGKPKSTVATTPLIKQKVAECYQSFRGYSENKFYNDSSITKCKTNCYSYIGILLIQNRSLFGIAKN